MAQSSSYNANQTRDNIIGRALRIVGAYGEGESPSTAAVTAAAMTLNDLVKEWQADGMQLWTRTEYTLTPVATTSSYTVGVGSTISTVAPLKVLQAWHRLTSTSADTPLRVITRDEYNRLSNKTQAGAPTHLCYEPPGGISGSEMQGTFYLWPVPDTNFVTSTPHTVRIYGTRPLMDFDTSSDAPDFPTFYNNALVWGLADQLAYEYHTGEAERSMISKKAALHLSKALSFDMEEGSLFLTPEREYGG